MIIPFIVIVRCGIRFFAKIRVLKIGAKLRVLFILAENLFLFINYFIPDYSLLPMQA